METDLSTDSINRAAATLGVTRPVMLFLRGESSHAGAMSLDLERGTIPSVLLHQYSEGPMRLVPRDHACQLLRKHGADGGAYVAEALEKLHQLDLWSVTLFKEGIAVSMFVKGVELQGHTTEYDTINRWPFFEIDSDRQPNIVTVDVPGSGHVSVAGISGHDALVAAGFVETILEGRMELPAAGRIESVTLDDDTLASALLRLSHKPHVIAEAICALRKLGDKDRWVTRVLQSRPQLRELANKVRELLDN